MLTNFESKRKELERKTRGLYISQGFQRRKLNFPLFHLQKKQKYYNNCVDRNQIFPKKIQKKRVKALFVILMAKGFS